MFGHSWKKGASRRRWKKVRRLMRQGEWQTAVRAVLGNTTSSPNVYTDGIGILSGMVGNVPLRALGKGVSYEALVRQYIRRENEVYTSMKGYLCDVVIYVGEELNYLVNLIGALKDNEVKYRLILVEDGVQKKSVLAYIKRIAREYPDTRIVHNEQPLGYVKSINRGIIMTRNDVVIIHPHVQIGKGFLDRILAPICNDALIGAVFPFTDGDSLCGFPQMEAENHIFQGISTDEINAYFSEIRSVYSPVPSGGWFCMAMKQKAIKAVGIFDQQTFEKGDYSERDWSIRVREMGYQVVLAENVYVSYRSFTGEPYLERMHTRMESRKRLLDKHPDYEQDLEDYYEQDPLSPIRSFVFARIASSISREREMIFQHALGGGSSRYIDDHITNRVSEGYFVLLVQYIQEQKHYQVSAYYRSVKAVFFVNELSYVFDMADRFKINHLFVNQLYSFPNLKAHIAAIVSYATDYGARLITAFHDYYVLCPSLYLLNQNHQYCRLPDPEVCRRCYSRNEYRSNYELPDIESWRGLWRQLLDASQEIRVFSEDSMRLIGKVYGSLDQMHVNSEREYHLPKLTKHYKHSEELVIGLFGTLTELKGASLVQQMLSIISKEKLKVRFVLLGSSRDAIRSPYFKQTGRYTPGEMPGLVLREDIDIVFIASLYPEGFSATTMEAMDMELPLVCLPLGAPADKIGLYEKGKVLTKTEPRELLFEIIDFAKQFEKPIVPKKRNVLFLYEGRTPPVFRVSNFRQQLLAYGIQSEASNLAAYHYRDIRSYTHIVFARCGYTKRFKRIQEIALRNGIQLIYDLDLSPESMEKTLFERLAFAIKKSPVIMVPDPILAQQVKSSFSGHDVMIRQNVVDYQMLSEASMLLSLPKRKRLRHSIGVWLDSPKLEESFEAEADFFHRLMINSPDLVLHLYGTESVPETLYPYSERIINHPLLAWTQVLSSIRNLDLMLLLPSEEPYSARTWRSYLLSSLVKVPLLYPKEEASRSFVPKEMQGIVYEKKDLKRLLKTFLEEEGYGVDVAEKASENLLLHRSAARLEPSVLDYLFKEEKE